MNIFEAVKDSVTTRQAAEMYGIKVRRNGILSGSLRCQPGYFPAYHMNKDQWLSILLEGPQPENEIKELIELSFRATAAKK